MKCFLSHVSSDLCPRRSGEADRRRSICSKAIGQNERYQPPIVCCKIPQCFPRFPLNFVGQSDREAFAGFAGHRHARIQGACVCVCVWIRDPLLSLLTPFDNRHLFSPRLSETVHPSGQNLYAQFRPPRIINKP